MFTFKGISTKEMRIIVEEPDNLIAKAPIKHEILNIEGRDDAIYYPLGRSPIEISLTLQLLEPSKVDQVLMWLDGEGELIYKDRKTRARIFSEVQPIRTSGIRLINIDVVRAPYWNVITDDYSKPWGINLIPNGWDSFVEYGSGKNYVENWNFESDDLSEFRGGNAMVIEQKNNRLIGKISSEGTLMSSAILLMNIANLPLGVYVFRVRMKSTNPATRLYYRPRNSGVDRLQNTYELIPNKMSVLEFTFERTVAEDFDIYIYANNPTDKVLVGDTIEIEWLHLTSIDNQHLVIEKSRLGNGLTRIQTWGGNNPRKLRFMNDRLDEKLDLNFSMFLKENNYDMYMEHDTGTREVINKDFEGYHSHNYQTNVIGNRIYNLVEIRASSSITNLDFTASHPKVVKGHKAPTWEADEHPRIVNEGNAVAKPLIRLTKGTSSTCEFEVNGIYFKYHFNQDDEVVIDCEKMEASDKGQLRNRHLTIGYEFPKLDPGPNVVKTISGDAIIEFKRKDRWL